MLLTANLNTSQGDPAAEDTVVACRNLSVTLGENPILHDLDAHVGHGETVALLGGNGSGKTTLLRALLGLVPRRTGTVALFGTPIERFHQWYRVGYVPQHGLLQVNNASVYELVATGRLSRRGLFVPPRKSDRDAIAAALEQVGLTRFRNAQVSLLSGGQRQRALIARALAGRPELIMLDEPLAGLDLATQESLAELFADLKAAGLSTIVVLHELGPLEGLIDRSIVLGAGQVLYDGPLRSDGSALREHSDTEPGPSPLLQGPTLLARKEPTDA